MRFLGIDYGTKRVGLAVSETDGKMAFPLNVLKNNKNLRDDIKNICEKEKIGAVVLGESFDLSGKPNNIMGEIISLKEYIEKEIKLPVFLEPEFYTTAQTKHIQGDIKLRDASAAAIILQSYLDKNKKNNL